MFAAGKSVGQVSHWLQEIGFSPEEAEAFLSEFPQARRTGSWAWRGGAIGVALAGIVSAGVTVLYRPWTVTWISARTGMPIDPLVAVGFYWCGGLLVLAALCGLVGTILGVVLERLRE
jgi:hypothetical protein